MSMLAVADQPGIVPTKKTKDSESTGSAEFGVNRTIGTNGTVGKNGLNGTSHENFLSIVEQLDQDYTQQVSTLNLGDVASYDPLDYITMRKWLKDVYLSLDMKIPTKRSRATASIRIEDVPITYVENKNFRLRIWDPAPDTGKEGCLRPALLMLHGGGWIHSFPETDEDLAKFFASELRAVVIGVDYRLAPEYPFPAPLDDCYEALNWTIAHAAEYNIDHERIGLWGGSAGANLGAAVALRDSMEHSVSRLRHANLVVPVTCHPDYFPEALKSSEGSHIKFPFVGNKEESMVAFRKLWAMYAGDHASSPYASVLLGDPKPNHAAVHITVAGCDALRDEGIAYALHLRNAGIDTQLEIIPGVPHGINVSPKTFVAMQFFRNQARVLNYALNTDY